MSIYEVLYETCFILHSVSSSVINLLIFNSLNDVSIYIIYIFTTVESSFNLIRNTFIYLFVKGSFFFHYGLFIYFSTDCNPY